MRNHCESGPVPDPENPRYSDASWSREQRLGEAGRYTSLGAQERGPPPPGQVEPQAAAPWRSPEGICAAPPFSQVAACPSGGQGIAQNCPPGMAASKVCSRRSHCRPFPSWPGSKLPTPFLCWLTSAEWAHFKFPRKPGGVFTLPGTFFIMSIFSINSPLL